MPIVYHKDVPPEAFPGGASYRTIVGDGAGSTPIRCGIQVSPPGYETPDHSHPYLEVITVLEGTGEAWIEGRDGTVPLEPGMTLVIEPGRVHGFRTTGTAPLTTYGVHASPNRIVEVREDGRARD